MQYLPPPIAVAAQNILQPPNTQQEQNQMQEENPQLQEDNPQVQQDDEGQINSHRPYSDY